MTPASAVALALFDEAHQRIVPGKVIEPPIGREDAGPALRVAPVERLVVAGVQLLDVDIVLGRE